MRKCKTILVFLIAFAVVFVYAEKTAAEEKSESFWTATKLTEDYREAAFMIESAYIPTDMPGRTVQGMDTIDIKFSILIDNPSAVYPMGSIDEYSLKQWSAKAYLIYKGHETGLDGIVSNNIGAGKIILTNNRNESITVPVWMSVCDIEIQKNYTSDLINFLCASTSLSVSLYTEENELVQRFEIMDSSGIHAALMSMGIWGAKEGTKIHTDYNDLGTGTVMGLSTVQIDSADQTILRIQFPNQSLENWFPYPDCLDQGWAYIVLE